MADGPLVSDSTALIHITLSTQQTGNQHFFEASDLQMNFCLENGYLTFVLITKYEIEKYFMHIEISTLALVHVTYVNIYLSIQDYL